MEKPTEAFYDFKRDNLTTEQLAEKAVDIATKQIMACHEFKKPRLARINKYWELYDGKTQKKLRQLFNVPIPVFAGMVDTLNAQYDTPVQLKFKEGDAADYFKVQKINGAFQMEVMNSSVSSKWDSKLRIARKNAIIEGRAILEYNVSSDPEYKSTLDNVQLKNFNFQPKGGMYLENHLFAGREDIEKTKADIRAGVASGIYNRKQAELLVQRCEDNQYIPGGDYGLEQQLSRFKPLNLNPTLNAYVGQTIYKMCTHIMELDGERYYLFFNPWTKTWLRFEKWKKINSSGLYPWVTYATHEDPENFLSKSYGDDLYAAADAIVAMFNQELTNREKRNFSPRAYDKEMFTDLRKLDEAAHRPDALVPVDTKGGQRRIADGIYEMKTGELQGTVNLIDWITGSLGRNTGATDLAMGGVQEVSKKASVTFAEQKSVSKRIGWGAQPFQDMMADLGKLYIYGLKDHMPSKMAIRMLGETGWDWDEITRMDLDTERDIDVLIISTDEQMRQSEIKAKRRADALAILDPNFINPKKKNEEILRSVGEYEDNDIAEFMDMKTYNDRKAISKAAEKMELIKSGKNPQLWYGANQAFMKKIVNTATDRRDILGMEVFTKMINYAMAHKEIVMQNIEREIAEQAVAQGQQVAQQGGLPPEESQAVNPGMSGGMSRAMSVANEMA